jgi:hypothetical protein
LNTRRLAAVIILIIISALSIGVGIGFIIALVLSPQLGLVSIISSVIGVFISAMLLFKGLIKELFEARLKPALRYGTLKVQKDTSLTSVSEYNHTNYFLEIENKAHGIEAKECKGKITVVEANVKNRQMLWESGLPSIAIGHEELLRLFEISESSDGKTILFYYEPVEYNEIIMRQKKISVKIQSENAECPIDAYVATIGEIIDMAK